MNILRRFATFAYIKAVIFILQIVEGVLCIKYGVLTRHISSMENDAHAINGSDRSAIFAAHSRICINGGD